MKHYTEVLVKFKMWDRDTLFDDVYSQSVVLKEVRNFQAQIAAERLREHRSKNIFNSGTEIVSSEIVKEWLA